MSNSRRALIVGINTYQHAPHLSSCVADAEGMAEVLAEHEDGRLNYDCRLLADTTEKGDQITTKVLREACMRLFADTKDDVLLYFSGHGALTEFGGYLCAYDSERNSWGISMDDIMTLAKASRAREIVMILDCCHSGAFADPALFSGAGHNPLALLRDDMTVMAASLDSQSAFEGSKYSVFTGSVIDALQGSAADHLGWVTAPAIYAYVERRFGWKDQQRPVYKSYATSAQVVRECAALIDRLKLRRIVELFPTADHRYQLDPEYELEDEHGKVREPVNHEKVAIGKLFKTYRDASLLLPSDRVDQLFGTAQKGHTVELTLLGREYWWLVKNRKI
jgi:uncharacterized caspase-like protein